LNEGKNIRPLLVYLKELDDTVELIVSDGGSVDNTVEQAKSYAKLIQAPRGRGAQMNAGAKAASGDILWFLHADCSPHPKSIGAMKKALINPQIVGGAFEYNLNDPSLYFRIVEFLSNQKNHLLKLFYGDMGIFVRREIFFGMNGYAEIPFMEDMDFCKRLKKQGKTVILPYRINTSARRWHDEGLCMNAVRNWLLQIAWALGTSPKTLSRFYKFK
jgi:rSAM/selenodomain-associated transferase 2